MPPVAGSISWPEEFVINPVVALTLDDALADEDVDVEADAAELDEDCVEALELDAVEDAALDEEDDALAEEVLCVDCVSGCAFWNLAQTSLAELDHTTRFLSEGAASTGMVCA